MSAKFITLLLGSLLLVNYCYTGPASSEESKESSEKNDLKNDKDEFQLLETLVTEVLALHVIVLKDGKEVLEKVLNDPKVLEVKSEAMEEDLKVLREYVEKLSKDEKGSHKVFEYEIFEDHVNKYKKEKHENLSPEEEIIGNSLKENGLEDVEQKVEKHFKEFIEDFKVKIVKYAENMSDEEKNDGNKHVSDWLDKLNEETDIEKQFQIFHYFFSVASDESD